MKMAEMVRINTRISAVLNNWLDKRSKETGVPKSTLVFLALEQYMTQTESIARVSEISEMIEMLKGYEQQAKK